MQSAQATDMDFSGSFNQTYLFDNDVAVLKHNIVETEKFIASLGQRKNEKNAINMRKILLFGGMLNSLWWKKYLEEYKFNSRLGSFQ